MTDPIDVNHPERYITREGLAIKAMHLLPEWYASAFRGQRVAALIGDNDRVSLYDLDGAWDGEQPNHPLDLVLRPEYRPKDIRAGDVWLFKDLGGTNRPVIVTGALSDGRYTIIGNGLSWTINPAKINDLIRRLWREGES